MSPDIPALVFSFIYVFAMIGIAEGLRRLRGYSVDFTRKFIHVAVGMWSWGTVLLFDHRVFAVIPPLAFVAINAFSYWQGTFKAMETGDKENLGTIYFPVSFAAILWFLWDHPHLVVAALMPMTWGDALAAVVGRRIGRRHYSVLGSRRSLEGSVAMFLTGWVATLAALLLLAPPGLGPGTAITGAALTALGAALIEAISPWGIDNLTVPMISAAIVVTLLG